MASCMECDGLTPGDDSSRPFSVYDAVGRLATVQAVFLRWTEKIGFYAVSFFLLLDKTVVC